jgi:hypothetical protein
MHSQTKAASNMALSQKYALATKTKKLIDWSSCVAEPEPQGAASFSLLKLDPHQNNIP